MDIIQGSDLFWNSDDLSHILDDSSGFQHENSLHRNSVASNIEDDLCKGKSNEKRRARAKVSEQQRRNRLNDLIKDLEALVFKEKTTSKKVTKEEVLQHTIIILSKAIEKDEQETDNQLTPTNQKTVSIELKENIQDQHAEITFQFLHLRTLNNMINAKTVIQKQRMIVLLNELEEIAASTGKLELELQVAFLAEMFYSMIYFNPMEEEKINSKAFLLFRQMKTTPSKSLKLGLPKPHADAGLFILQRKAQVFATRGKFERALNLWRGARVAALHTNDTETLAFYYGGIGSFYYQLGEPVPLDDKYEKIEKTSFTLQPLVYLAHGLSILDHSMDSEEIAEGTKLILMGYNALAESASISLAESCFGPFMVYAHLKSGNYEEGLQLAEDLLCNGVSGLIGRGDIERMKGELLIGKYHSNLSELAISRTIYQTLCDALQSALSVGANTSYLRAAISFSNFLILMENNPIYHNEITHAINVMRQALDQVECSSRFSIVRNAQDVLDKLISITKRQQQQEKEVDTLEVFERYFQQSQNSLPDETDEMVLQALLSGCPYLKNVAITPITTKSISQLCSYGKHQ